MKKKIAYYLWRFPIVSETFIQREIKALKDAGLNILVFADSIDEFERTDPALSVLISDTQYLHPISIFKLFYVAVINFIKNPIICISVFNYVYNKKYDSSKNLKQDIAIFLKSLYLGHILKEQEVEHLHSPWSDVNSFILLLTSKLTGLPISIQARAHDIHREDSAFALNEKFSGSKFIVTNTEYNKEYIKKIVKSDEWEKINLIYNGIDLSYFNPVNRTVDKNKELYLLCVARLIPQKGLTYLVKACDILKKKGFRFKCNIIGGTEEPRYRDYYLNLLKLTRDLGLEKCVNFDGIKPFEYTMEQYNNADIFILPCVIAKDGSRDIIPNVLIEAMAMKLPVISTPVTGVPEIVDNEKNGILVPPNDERKLAEAIVGLIGNSNLRVQLGENARLKVEERFDINKNIQSYLNLFS